MYGHTNHTVWYTLQYVRPYMYTTWRRFSYVWSYCLYCMVILFILYGVQYNMYGHTFIRMVYVAICMAIYVYCMVCVLICTVILFVLYDIYYRTYGPQNSSWCHTFIMAVLLKKRMFIQNCLYGIHYIQCVIRKYTWRYTLFMDGRVVFMCARLYLVWHA